jgi:hypothetical protein
MPSKTQFECFFDFRIGKHVLRRVNAKACIYQKLYANEQQELLPGDMFGIGSLQFEVQRFNVGIVSDIG